ncbi:ABC transporter ATP-binding protein [Paenibacillus arenosi]|uniref:ABC transporter ATP-binding protein n=1 Tax=Paenibacillus arenosi TaxID=2774142 RepID=A0ABR9B3B0_9BACL|nr:ABC transporter ATP-binding protein [Paenibacillus arenosi]MBD8500853.1 ABC transporter ATP-binding protein [Paenibacillus arenosi]
MTAREEVLHFKVINIVRSFKLLPRVFKILWETHHFYFLTILILNVVKGLIPAALLLATQNLINSVVIAHGNSVFDGVIYAFFWLIAITLLNELVGYTESYFHHLFETMLSNEVNIKIMEKSVKLSLATFEEAEVQDQLTRAQSEANSRPYQIFMTILSLISGTVTLLSTAAILLVWRWWVAILLILLPVTSFVSFLKLGQREFDVHFKRAPKMRESWYLSFLLTKDVSFKEIKLFNLGNYLLGHYKNIYSQFFVEDKKLAFRRFSLSILFQLLNLVVISSVIFLVLWSAYTGEIMIGSFVAMVQAVSNTQSSSQGVLQHLLSLCQHNLYMQQLFAFLDLKIEKASNRESDVALNDKINRLELKDVSFKYPNKSKYAVHEVSLELNKGETLALVGKNGSGKSTLVKLLTQLYQGYSGNILVNGYSARDMNHSQLLERIGVVFQDFVHYEMSMRHNIAFGEVHQIDNDKHILEAARKTGILPLINQLPQGLDTQMGKWFEEGHQLSGGQWQRVAIARAYIRNADLYILDEPSAFLDPEAEYEVFQMFRQLVADRMGIFISHRFSSVRYADKIAVMDEGRIVEYGSHYDLMALRGLYYELYTMQASAYLDNEKVVKI